MSVKISATDETNQIAEWCKTHSVKRFPLGETSNWDERPFRERHIDMARKAAARRRRVVESI